MTNQLRAETTLKFPNNVSYKAKMSLDTCMSIESALNMSIYQLATKLSTGGLIITDIITIITLAVRSGGNDIKDSDTKALVSDIGMTKGIAMVGDLLTLALMSDDEDTGEKKNQTEKII